MKVALLHRHKEDEIKATNAAFPFLKARGLDVFSGNVSRTNKWVTFNSLLWILYSPFLVRGKGYDVIYCDDSFPFYAGLVKLACPKSKVVLRLGDLQLMYHVPGWLYPLFFIFEKWSWSKVDRIIAISEAMAEYVRKHTKTPVSVVLDPVNPKDFEVRENLEHHGKVVMFHGTLTKNKNIDIILECARHMPDIHFVIIGAGPDYKRLLLVSPSNVYFTGWLPFDQVKYHLHMCDVGLSVRGDNPGNEYVVTSPFVQYGVIGKPCVVNKRKVFGDYPYQFIGVNEMVRKIRFALDDKGAGRKLQDYILCNHDARKIAYKIWRILERENNS